jgi:16S rRNA (uracil1498-N3)-methyltransferase
MTFDHLIARSPSFDQRLVGDPNAEPWGTDPLSGQTILAVIGPEGGLTDAESSALHQAGYRSVSWGRFVLRIETAAIAAAAVLR